jgi:hypothetical protein
LAQLNNFDIYKGEAVTISWTMLPVTDITGWHFKLTLRVNANDAAIALSATPAVTNASGGVFAVTLSHADTNALGVGTFAYDVQRTDGGGEAVLSIGVISVLQEVLFP